MTPDPHDAPPTWSSHPQNSPRVLPLPPLRQSVPLLTSAALHDSLIALRDADVIHLHGAWSTANLQVARLARGANTPYVVSTHGMLDAWSTAQKRIKKRVFHYLVGARFLRRAACVHYTAAAERDQARRWLNHPDEHVIPTPLDLGPYRNLPGPEIARARFPALSDPRPKLLFMSRLHPKKGLERLLRAIPHLNDAGIPCRVIIAGSGEPAYESTLRRHSADLNVVGQTSFVGFVAGATKISLLQACDVFVLPTSQENFGMVLFEAMAAALPVITTEGVDVWSELQQGGAKIVPADPARIAEAVGDCVRDPGRLSEIGARSRSWVMDYLNAGPVAAAYERLYEAAVAQRRGGQHPVPP